jgi:hypothetical protein
MVPGIWRASGGLVGGPALAAENELAIGKASRSTRWSARSASGQKAKYSPRAHEVRFAPDNGLKSDLAGGPFRADRRHAKCERPRNRGGLSIYFTSVMTGLSLSLSYPNLVRSMTASSNWMTPSA